MQLMEERDLLPDYRITENEIDFQVKANEYIAPDEVWEIHLSKEEYTPPFTDLYTSPHLEHYNIGEAREARAMIKLGEGNNKLTRPLILVDGVDFSHDVVLEKGTDRVIRYGDTGWENVIQGVESSFTPEGTPELFRTYPTLLRTMNEEQDEKGDVNYDIILVEFKDGADYIDRCAKLIQKVIERINNEKECGYENVIVGLSMGGQATRIALTQMEKNGIDHDCSEYISFDSPHQYANIPLGVQALVYTAGFIAGNEGIGRRFEELNRPAALQMLRFNLYTEMANNHVTMTHSQVYGEIDFPEVLKFITNTVSLQNPIAAWKLRDYYTNLQEELGYPKYCKNTALGMGSSQGTSLHNSDCIIEGQLIFGADVLTDPLTMYAKEKLGEELFNVKLMAIGGEDDEIMSMTFLDTKERIFHKVTLTRNQSYPNVDIAPGCSRGDVFFLRDQLSASLREPLYNQGIFTINSPWYQEWTCQLPTTTFMPTASVIGVETDDLTMNLKDEIFVYKTITTPFDEIFLTEDNLGHVEVLGENEEGLAGNDVGAFLVGRAEANVQDMPELTILPSSEHGAKYNYGLYKRRLSSFILNKGGVLSVNHRGETHFVDTDPREASNKEYFKSMLAGATCLAPTEIEVNQGGLFQLGDPNSNTKSGEVRMFEGSSLRVDAGGKMTLENNSKLIVDEGASITLSGGKQLFMNGQGSELVIGGNFYTNGDVTIECKGKIVLLPTAKVNIGGKLTINGDVMNDNLLEFHKNATLSTNNDFEIHNGTIVFHGNNKINVENTAQTIFENISMEEGGNINSEIQITNVSNALLTNVQASNFFTTTPFRIEGNGTESVQIESSTIKNGGNALILNDMNSVNIFNSNFISFGEFNHPSEGLIRISNGIDAKNIAFLNIENTTFDGFVYNPKLVSKEPDTPKKYGLKLQDVNTTNILSSTFSDSDYGILVPEQGLITDNDVNETNIYMHGVKILNNLIGIEMSGGFAKSSSELNYGHLYLECTRIQDNREKGIRGFNILISADNYFADGENEINYFRPHTSTAVNEGGLIDLNYSFNDNYINPILLRGNVWSTAIPSQYISATSGSIDLTVETYPEYGSEDFPTINECYTLKDEKDMKGDCLGCFTSDDTDGGFALNSNGKTIMETLREGIRHLSDGDLVTAKATFQHIANVPSATIKTLHAKSQYAYELSRVYATPEASFGNRSKSNAHSLVKLDLAIYPNPTTSDISLDVTEAGDYRITSVNGEVVQTGTYQVNDLIQLQDNTPGIYFVYFKSQSGLEKTGRFILVK